jgi:hypothetical protein
MGTNPAVNLNLRVGLPFHYALYFCLTAKKHLAMFQWYCIDCIGGGGGGGVGAALLCVTKA